MTTLQSFSAVAEFETVRYELPSADGMYDLQFADLNADGWVDVVVSSYGSPEGRNGVWVYLHTGDPAQPYAACSRYPVSRQLRLFAIGDIDGDGDPDLVVPDTGYLDKAGYLAGESSIELLLNDSRGSFTPGAKLKLAAPRITWAITRRQESPLGPVDVKLVDLDRDGALDIVCSRFGLPNLEIFRNDGSGLFAPGESIEGSYFAPAVASGDLDRDGLPDLVFVHGYLDKSAPNQVSVALQRRAQGRPTWSVTEHSRSDGIGADAWGVAISDFAGDGSAGCVITHVHDFALTGKDSSRIMLGAYEATVGRLTFKTIDESLREPLYPRVVDFNRDGRPDILVTDHVGNRALVLLNPGAAKAEATSPAWRRIEIPLDHPYPFVADAADVNRDGKVDIAVPFLFDEHRDSVTGAVRLVPSQQWVLLMQK